VTVTHNDASLLYERKKALSAKDIGDIPYVKDRNRRSRAEQSLSFFCQTYQAGNYNRPFSDVHYAVLNRMEMGMKQGGLFAYAMPRGTGKTTIIESAVVWAILSGHRHYVVLISATEKLALQSLDNIKKELSSNDMIYDDWPEVAYPIWALEGAVGKASGQLLYGESTYLVWKGEKLVMPTVPNSKVSGSVIEVRGITGSIRGMKANLPGGRGSIRPELVVLDDPQTDESAKSPQQCIDREKIILGTILGLAGHENEIAAVMPCTVIHKGDLAEKFLDVDKHPEWNGVRTGLLKIMPSNIKLWEQYADLRRDQDEAAHNLYIENRVAMDEGAIPMWEECYTKGQLSAIQYAMDLKIKVGEEAFWAEYMNSPLDDIADSEVVTIEQVLEKTTAYQRWQVPPNVSHLTAFIDVHKAVLYYMVCGWDSEFNGYILQYNIWPETNRKYFTKEDISETLAKKYGGEGTDGQIYAGLRDCTEKLLFREWGHTGLDVGLCIIDANWRTATVKQFCREIKWKARILPGHGRFIGADRKPLDEFDKKTGDTPGHYWRIPAAVSGGGVRHIIYDINYWKSFVNSSLLAPPGERGCIQLFSGADHQCVAEHFTSEYPSEVSARGRVVNQWQPYPGRKDTHWWDCLVGCAVGASRLGSSTVNKKKILRTRTRVSYME